jgi:opacity protein-like surface antigen
MRRTRLGAMLVSGCVATALTAVAGASPAQAADASVIPARSVITAERHGGSTTVRALAMVNAYRGSDVEVLTATSGGASLRSEGTVHVSESGYANLFALVDGLSFRPGGRIVMSIVYTPPGTSGERYAKTLRITFSSGGGRRLSEDCSFTFGGSASSSCTQPCPAPSGISVPYCDGVGVSLHFQIRYPYVLKRGAVQFKDFTMILLNLRSSLAVLCHPAGGSRCPSLVVYPRVNRHRVRLRSLLGRRLAPGTSIQIVFYRGNFTAFSIQVQVRRGRTVFVTSGHTCLYPDKLGPARCTRPEG